MHRHPEQEEYEYSSERHDPMINHGKRLKAYCDSICFYLLYNAVVDIVVGESVVCCLYCPQSWQKFKKRKKVAK